MLVKGHAKTVTVAHQALCKIGLQFLVGSSRGSPPEGLVHWSRAGVSKLMHMGRIIYIVSQAGKQMNNKYMENKCAKEFE